jgi:aconitate hydratase
MPSNAKLLPYRSNIPYLSQFCFSSVDSEFYKNCEESKGGFIVAGDNYGQGSSREHAALVPLYLGIKGIIAKSFARIHKSNLINSGILPLVFADSNDYSEINAGDELEISNIKEQLNNNVILALNKNSSKEIKLLLEVTDRERQILISGGYINYISSREGENANA